MSTAGNLYNFVFRGLLAEEALDQAGRQRYGIVHDLDPSIAQRLSVDVLDERFVESARRMAVVYVAIAAFENSVRKLVSTRLLEELGESWWEQGVSERIRKKSESRKAEEEKIKWHAPRGTDSINYTELGDLAAIIRNNWLHFEAYIPSIEWATSVFSVLERSRNVIMHSGELELEDVERVGINIRDWIKQVGA
jgi:hypothetical protein